MGGFGSGRSSWSNRASTSNYYKVDIRRWLRDGLLITGNFGWQWTNPRTRKQNASISVSVENEKVRLTYTLKNGNVAVDCPVRFLLTPSHVGKHRPWFICPCCHRHAVILYLGNTPACRRCYRLSYPSQRETPDSRAMHQIDKIRERLGWQAGFLNGHECKPKGMHWSTYQKLVEKHDQLADQSLSQMNAQMEKLESNLRRVNHRIAQRGQN